MGADATVVFFGIRFELEEDDIESVEIGEHPYIEAAKRVQLQTHFGRESETEPHFLFIGKRLTWIGSEHKQKDAISREALTEVMDDVQQKLAKMGAREAPQLHVQIEFDQ